MYHVGLDWHTRQSTMQVLDENGKCFKRLQIKGTWTKVLQGIDEQVPRPFAICFEASCGYGPLHDGLSQRAARVQMAHPGHLRLIFRAKRKNDRFDCAKLAKLSYLDAVPQVHVPAQDVRQWRGLIHFRAKLLGKRTAVKNQIRALLRGCGTVSAAGRGLWTKKGLICLAQLPLGELADLQKQVLLEELSQLQQKIKSVTRQLDKIGASHPGVLLLRTIPGVGPRTAEALVAWIDDVRRFGRNNQLGSYFGLVPCQDSSAGVNRLGHITKEGPALVRQLLCEASWQGIRRCPGLKARFQRIMNNDPDRRKIALVAVAHHLACVAGAMLRDGVAWRQQE